MEILHLSRIFRGTIHEIELCGQDHIHSERGLMLGCKISNGLALDFGIAV